MRLTLQPPEDGLEKGTIRLAGLVSGHSETQEKIWIDLPAELVGDVIPRLDAWLLWLLPHAFATGQELVLEGGVDATLLHNAEALMEIWSQWRPERRPVRIIAESVREIPEPAPKRTGLFFTGGVDSFFTLLHYDESAEIPSNGHRPTDDLIYVWGFDIPLSNASAFHSKRETLRRIADRTGKNLVILATNLREKGVRQPWGPVMHGPALGGAGLLLGRRWEKILLSSWFTIGDEFPWGSTAETDPLLSTSTTQTIPYGETHDRFEKLAFLSRHSLAMESLHVCWMDGSERNCGRCEKCFRTLLALDLLGARERAATFPAEPFDPTRLAELWRDEPLFVRFYERFKVHAQERGRQDIVAAIDACLARSPRN